MYCKYSNRMWTVTTIVSGRVVFSSAVSIKLALHHLTKLIQRNNGEIK